MARKKEIKNINIYDLDLFDIAIARHLVNELYKATEEIETNETISDKVKQYILQRFAKWKAEIAEVEDFWKKTALESLMKLAEDSRRGEE